jgi:predicted glycosyltransferase
MGRPIGYYVHHHGDGHRQRALAVARAMGGSVTLLGSGLAGQTGDVPAIDLPDDRLGALFDGDDQTNRPSTLHYTPIDHEGIRQRVARITEWIAQNRPALMIVDVSVEIAMLARLASIPTVYVRLSGRRFDQPHIEAFRSATALLAPFHQDLDDEATPDAIREKTFYAPGIIEAGPGRTVADDNVVLVVIGRGGGVSDGARWAQAAAAVPDMRWRIIGPCTVPSVAPANLELRGWVDDPASLISSARLVIGAAGDGLVSTVIAHRRPFLCLPEPRPFDEQMSKARRLSALGAALVRTDWPGPAQWPALVREACALDPLQIGRLDQRGGTQRVADWLRQLAANTDARSQPA